MSRTYAEQLLDHIGRPGVDYDTIRGAASALNRQAAEIERLRSALAEIAETPGRRWQRKIAKAALDTKEPKA